MQIFRHLKIRSFIPYNIRNKDTRNFPNKCNREYNNVYYDTLIDDCSPYLNFILC